MTQLSIGPSADTVTGNRIALDDGANYMLSAVQIHVGNATLNGMVIPEYVRDAVQRGTAAPAQNREISIGLVVKGSTEAIIRTNLAALQKVLKQARDYAKLGSLGAPVVLVWQPDASSTESYLDVVGGHITQLYRVGKATSGAGRPVTLVLACRPFFRQKQTVSGNPTVVIATSGTTTDAVATYRIADTGGDADGLLKLTLTDQSIGGKIINRVRVGRRSLAPLASGDWTPLLVPSFVSPGISFTDATARGGATPRLSATSAAWQTFATVSQSGTGAAQGGEVTFWARLRDSSPYINPTDTTTAPTVTPSTASGTMPPDTYLVRLATVDANGVESAAGYPQTAVLPHATAGLYDTFESGSLSNWDNSGYTQFYREASAAATTQSGSAGSLSAIPDAAYEGTYGVRALVTSSVGATANAGDVYRCVLQKGAQGVAVTTSGTSTVYGRFRINQITTPDGLMQPFIVFFSAAQGNTSGSVVGFSPDYTGGGAGGSNNSSGVLAGLRFVAGDIWQVCAPYGPGATWTPLPGYYIHLTNGQWYSFACSMSATYNGVAGQYKVTFLGLTIDGVLVTPAQSITAVSANFPTTGAALTPTVGAQLFGPPIAASPFWDLNDILSVDFDDVGAEASATLGNLAVSWSAISGASSYNVYYTPVENPNTWGRVVLGNVTSTTISTPVSTTATLPQSRLSGVIAPALVRVQALPPNAAAVGPIASQGGSPIVGRSVWGPWTNIGSLVLPTIPPQDGATSPAAWVLQLQAIAGGANVSTIDCDTLVTISADEDQLVWEVPSSALPSLSIHVADVNRLDRQGVTITPVAGGTATAYASVAGQMHAGQGDTLLVAMLEVSDGASGFISDIVNTKCTIGAVVVPRVESI